MILRDRLPQLRLVALMAILLLASPVLAQSSLGIGAAEPMRAPVSQGIFGEMSRFVFAEQQRFYRLMTDTLRAMRQTPEAGWTLAGLSFLYGIFHAAGPGHGKAVISSYMVANEVALRRGVALSFVSAFLQALVAIALIGAVFLVLRGTAIRQTDAVYALEILSYAFVTAFGAWLLARKTWPLLRGVTMASSRQPALAGAEFPRGSAFATDADGHSHSHDGRHHRHGHSAHGHDHSRHHHHDGHDHSAGSCSCGHAHIAEPAALTGETLRWREAASAVVAVGLRPCSGALIILTFAFLNGMIVTGIGSVLAMALGTAITVATLATLAVSAKNVAIRFAGGAGSRMAQTIQLAIEMGGALLITLLGVMLLTGSLAYA